MIGVVHDLYPRIIMKIFFIYILFVLTFVVGFTLTLTLGLPRTTSHDGLVALSGMLVGAICASMVIFFSNKDIK